MPDNNDSRPSEGTQADQGEAASQIINVAIPGLNRREQEAIRAALDAINADSVQAVIDEVRLDTILPSHENSLEQHLRSSLGSPPGDYLGEPREELENFRDSCRAVIKRVLRKINQVLSEPSNLTRQVRELRPLLMNLGRQLFHETLLTLMIRSHLVAPTEVASRKTFYAENVGILSEIRFMFRRHGEDYPKIFSPEFPVEPKSPTDTEGLIDSVGALTLAPYRESLNEDVPTFDGNYREWDAFWAQFKTLVDDNPRILPIIKYRRLLKVLRGEARDQVKGFRYTAANYEPVKRHLQKVYGEPERILQYMKEKVNATKTLTSGSSYMEFTRFALLAQEYIRDVLYYAAINSSPTGYNAADVVYTIRKKLPEVSVLRWTDFSRGQDPAKMVQAMDEFLGQELEARRLMHLDKGREDHHRDKPSGSRDYNTSKGKPSKPTTYTFAIGGDKVMVRGKAPPGLADTSNCIFCLGPHFMDKCKSKLSADDRKKILLKKKKCLQCFREGHPLKNCPYGLCLKCQGRHHTSIHGAKYIPLKPRRKTSA